MLLSAEVAVAVEHQLRTPAAYDAVQYVGAAYIRQHNIPHAQVALRAFQDYAVASAFDVRAHAHAFGRELYLMPFLQQPPELG